MESLIPHIDNNIDIDLLFHQAGRQFIAPIQETEEIAFLRFLHGLHDAELTGADQVVVDGAQQLPWGDVLVLVRVDGFQLPPPR